MPEPYNYTIQAPSNGAMQGFAQGIGLSQAVEQGQLARQQLQMQQAQQQQMQRDLGSVAQNPTVAGINQVMLKYPAIAEKFKPALDSATEQQKNSKVGQASDVYASLLAGRNDIAKQLLEEQATAAENSDNPGDAKHARVMAQLIDSGDAGAKTVLSSAGMFLSSAMGPDKFAESFSKLEGTARANEMAPAEQAKATADARAAGSNADIAAVKAKFADSQAAADLAKSGWDVKKIQNDIDISKQNVKIALMNAGLAKEMNGLKRQELGLQIQKAEQERDNLVRDKAAAVTTAQTSIDNMLSTAQQALNTDPSVIRRATGPLASKTLTLSQDTADFEELMHTLGSQAFLGQLQALKSGNGSSGMGALSDAEGAKLEKGLQNLSLRQSPERLMSNIKEVQRLMLKARDNLSTKYGTPGKSSELRPGVSQKTITVDF